MEQKQKRILDDALKMYQDLQKNIYQRQTDKFRWIELKSCSQTAICKRFNISNSVLCKALSCGKASGAVENLLDQLVYQVRLARLALSTKTDIDQFLEGGANG